MLSRHRDCRLQAVAAVSTRPPVVRPDLSHNFACVMLHPAPPHPIRLNARVSELVLVAQEAEARAEAAEAELPRVQTQHARELHVRRPLWQAPAHATQAVGLRALTPRHERPLV
jgi:hypothetical protein